MTLTEKLLRLKRQGYNTVKEESVDRPLSKYLRTTRGKQEVNSIRDSKGDVWIKEVNDSSHRSSRSLRIVSRR